MAAAWQDLDPGTRPAFPLISLVRAWHNRPETVHPDTRRHGIAPNAAFDRRARQPVRGRLPGLATAPLSEFKPKDSAFLPGFEPVTTHRTAAPPALALFDAAGLESLTQGRGAPLALRLWLEAMISAPVAARGKARFHLSLAEVVRWLWPNGWRPRVDRERLAAAFAAIDNARLPWEGEYMGQWGSGLWRPVSVVSLPTLDLKSSVVLDVELPPGSGPGPMIDRERLRGYGLDSAPAYRGYLAAAYHWNEHGTTHNGRRIRPTRPAVARNADGFIVDSESRIIRERGGKPTRNPYHKRAIPLGGEEVNPPAATYGLLHVFTPDELTALAYSKIDLANTANPRNYRSRAVDIFEGLAEDGAILLEPGHNYDGAKGWRILPPPGFGKPPGGA